MVKINGDMQIKREPDTIPTLLAAIIILGIMAFFVMVLVTDKSIKDSIREECSNIAQPIDTL